MSVALQGSPLKKPLIERLWRYVKDHPDVQSTSLASILSEDKKDVSRAVHNLRIRKMLLGTAVYMHRRNGQRLTYSLRVNPAMRGEYEVWPASKDPSLFRKQRSKSPAVAELSDKLDKINEAIKQEEHKVKTLADFKDLPTLSLKDLYMPNVEERTEWTPMGTPGLHKLDVKTMHLAEARRVYDELHQYFGAKT